MHRTRRLPWLLLALLALTACLPPPVPPVLKIGLVAPFEGRYRQIGYDAVYAARLAVREINDAGGVNGYALALVAFDDGGTADGAEAAAQALLVDEQVIAVIGHFRQESSAAAAPRYTAQGMPFLVIGAQVAPAPTTRQLSPPPARLAAAMIAVAGGDDCLTLWAGGDSPLRRALEASLGAGSAACAESRVISLLPPVRTADRLLAEPRPLVGTTPLLSADLPAIAGEAAEDVRIVTPYPLPRDVADSEGWREAVLAMGPHVPEPGPYALPTYEAVHLIAEAVARIDGTVGREGLAQALAATTREGKLGRITWDADGFWADAPLYGYRRTGEGLQRFDLP